MQLPIEILSSTGTVPSYAHETDSGADLYASESVTIPPYAVPTLWEQIKSLFGYKTEYPNNFAKVKTGISVLIPDGYEVQVRPKSGLSSKGILAVFGTVDQGYTGEIQAILYNFTREPYEVKVGQKISQMVLAPVAHPTLVLKTFQTEVQTDRGSNGFGSTGI